MSKCQSPNSVKLKPFGTRPKFEVIAVKSTSVTKLEFIEEFSRLMPRILEVIMLHILYMDTNGNCLKRADFGIRLSDFKYRVHFKCR